MKRIISLVLIALLVCACASAMAETMRVVNCEFWVSMRYEPSTTSDRVTTVPLGATVEAYYYSGDFIYCSYQGMSGYILSSYLAYDIPVNPSGSGIHVGTGSQLTVINCDSYVTLRSYPDTTAPAVNQVPLGATVTAYEQVGNFTRCTYNGVTGYILSRYLGLYNTRRIVNCESYVTLRSYPSTTAPAVTTVPLGASVEYIGYAGNGFAQCYYNGYEGYILSQYLG